MKKNLNPLARMKLLSCYSKQVQLEELSVTKDAQQERHTHLYQLSIQPTPD